MQAGPGNKKPRQKAGCYWFERGRGRNLLKNFLRVSALVLYLALIIRKRMRNVNHNQRVRVAGKLPVKPGIIDNLCLHKAAFEQHKCKISIKSELCNVHHCQRMKKGATICAITIPIG